MRLPHRLNQATMYRSLFRLVAAVAVIAALGSGVITETVSAASARATYDWSDLECTPDGWCTNYTGHYWGEAWWNTSSSTNFFTCHESTVLVDNPTPDITNAAANFEFYHGGQYKFTIREWDWNYGCHSYFDPAGTLRFGGNTDRFTYGYDIFNSGEARGPWGFQLCDGTGCYGGVSRTTSWRLW
jgi:hypothetical protein